MRKNCYTFILIFLMAGYIGLQAQDSNLAERYFREGKFKKAAALYQDLSLNNPYNKKYYEYLIKSWLELEDYDNIIRLVTKKLEEKPFKPGLWIDLGMAYKRKQDTTKASSYFDKALQYIEEKPNSGYGIARKFYEYHLLNEALSAYQLLTNLRPGSNYDFQIANIYGEMGDLKNMFDTYLKIVERKSNSIKQIELYMGRLISNDPDEESNRLFRELLLEKLRDKPDAKWNKLLSWLYIQQKDYHKALIQEKAIYLREESGFQGIMDVGMLALEEKDYDTAAEAFEYIIQHTDYTDLKIQAGYYLLEAQRKRPENTPEKVANLYLSYFNKYGEGSNTYAAQVSYADFLTFDLGQPEKAEIIIEKALKNKLSPYQEAELQMKLADILVFRGKYNRALIIYSKIQLNFRNHPLAQEARFKVARTSYFKGDFQWANTQLKVLKRGTSNLISNDALDLSLLIDENVGEDSIPKPLIMYAHADLLKYQNKNRQALDTLNVLLNKFKGRPIEDEALFMQGILWERMGKNEEAAISYEKIIQYHADDVLIDDALYRLGLLYELKLHQPDKAMETYEKIITGQASSIFLVDARRRYRKLRGDEINP